MESSIAAVLFLCGPQRCKVVGSTFISSDWRLLHIRKVQSSLSNPKKEKLLEIISLLI